MSEQEMCTCCTCGYMWMDGTNGRHSCATHLQIRIDELMEYIQLNAEREARDWAALDELTYSFDGRRKMEDIRAGRPLQAKYRSK